LPAEIEAWLNEEPAAEAQEIRQVWQLAEHARQFDTPGDPDLGRFERMRVAVKASVGDDARGEGRRGLLRLVNTTVLRAAAAMLVLALAGGYWWTRPVVYEAPLAGLLSVRLEDGTQVTLNSGSRLTHGRRFKRGARNVLLRGEAFFDVEHGEAPFIVDTFNGQVTVLGTRFNVRAWDSDDAPETEVFLEEGSVRFTAPGADVILRPGEASRIAGNARQPSAPASINAYADVFWLTGGFLFVDKPVGVVVDEIKRRFDVHVETNPASMREELVTLRLGDARSAEEVLMTVAAARGYRLEVIGEGYRLLSR